MRKGIEIETRAADRARLEAIVADRNNPQKHVSRGADHPGRYIAEHNADPKPFTWTSS